ncbi:hypothetical protein CALVIDRAFT_536359 [Calocera viscosa TUFC12733]|uniref:SET domain-containing protein n=1 Tax=Calocera viscosa (strain TUFC12733) TaxID=1330018 RepID=A0A167N4J9_CALVF|nr:hypothetical protein CALVIDRAFT_536359 [Calocera viscosa TUFC12733]
MPAPLAAPARDRARPSHTPPPNWPNGIPYLAHPVAHAGLPKHLVTRYCTPAPPPAIHPGPLTKITKIADPAHPAYGQYGLFATKKIPPKTWILDYTGVVHDQFGTDLASNYDLCLELLPVTSIPVSASVGTDDTPSALATELSGYWDIAVDAAKSGNASRFINDFRGVPGKSRPNVEFQSRKVEVSTARGKVEVVRIGVWSGKEGVAKGEELLLSYGRAFWKARRREEGDATEQS